MVTAFTIEAYKLLQDDPAQRSVQLLQQISQQLAQGANATSDSSTVLDPPPFHPPVQAIRINALWFSSLVCALFASLIGIVVKQWVREYMAVISLSSKHGVRLRQYRYDGLVAWHVPEIMAFLPILLELSLILFLIGLVDFLLLLQSTAAAIVTTLVALVLLFYVATTIAPIISRHCPFRSPQPWIIVRFQRKIQKWVHRWRLSSMLFDQSSPWPLTYPNFANWCERDNLVVWENRRELDLKAVNWIHATFVDDNVQNSLISIVQELEPDHAATLVLTVLSREVHISVSSLAKSIRQRSCSTILRDAGERLQRPTRSRIFHMLMRLLEHVPRDHEPSTIGPLDVLWTLWELCLGAYGAEDKDPLLYQSVLNALAQLLRESEPFRLRRAALNLLYESTHTWTYLYGPWSKCSTLLPRNCASHLCVYLAIGNTISFARDCYRHQIPDLFMKASAVVLLLLRDVGYDDDERQQLGELLRDLARLLGQCNEDGTRHEDRSAGKILSGIAILVEKDPELVSPVLCQALLEGTELGLLDLSQEEHVLLRELLPPPMRSKSHEHSSNGVVG